MFQRSSESFRLKMPDSVGAMAHLSNKDTDAKLGLFNISKSGLFLKNEEI